MASKVAAPQPTLEQISALAEIERARSLENDKTVKQVARKYLGHIYNKETNQIEEIAVENFTDETFVREDSKSLYVATLDATKETALNQLNITFGFNIAATVPTGSVPFKIGGGLDVGHNKTNSSDSSTVFCAVACVKKDRCGFQKMPKRLAVESESLHVGIIKSISVYAGYRVVLEIISSNNKAEKKTTVGVKAEASTLSNVIGGGIKFNYENSSLADRNIEQINIKEIISFGGYRVPSMQIPQGNDFPKIQEMFESIREHFELNYYSLVDRLILVHPTEDLVPFREIAPSSSRPSLPLSSELQPLKASVTPRNMAYYKSLADEIIPLLSESECGFLHHRVGERGYVGAGFRLDRMLYGIEISFSNILTGGAGSAPILLVGTDSSTIRDLGVHLMGGRSKQRRIRYPNGQVKTVTEYQIFEKVLSLDLFPDVFNSEASATIPSINSYGWFLETPILTNELSGHIPAEYDLCFGVATDFLFSHAFPKRIVVGMPQDFFQCSEPIDLIKKGIALFESLRRIVFDPMSCKESILFVMNGYTNSISDQIYSALKTLKTEKANREAKGGWFDKLKASFFGNSESMTNMKGLAEIEEALDAYAFIVGRLATVSDLQYFFREKATNVLQPSVRLQSSPSGQSSIPFADLPSQNFDRNNITLNSSSYFEMVVSIALRYMRYIENKVANLESQSITSLGLLKSYDRILTLLRQKEIRKIDKAEAENALGIAVTQELEKWATTKQKKEEEIRVNTKNIEAKRAKIEEWEKDTTPTPLKLTPNERISMRSFWRLPGLGKEYTFQTSYEFSKCQFSKTSGSFNCIEAEFTNTKKAVFTPKHWGYENDLRAYVEIWMEKRKHPETLKDIENYRADIKQLEETDKSLKKELKEIDDAIHEFTAKNIKVIEGRVTEKKAAFSKLSSELDNFRSKLIQHHEYYEILKGVHSRKSLYNTTNYYGLTPVLASFIPGKQDRSTELSIRGALKEVQSRREALEEERSLMRAQEEEQFLRRALEEIQSGKRTLEKQQLQPHKGVKIHRLGDLEEAQSHTRAKEKTNVYGILEEAQSHTRAKEKTNVYGILEEELSRRRTIDEENSLKRALEEVQSRIIAIERKRKHSHETFEEMDLRRRIIDEEATLMRALDEERLRMRLQEHSLITALSEQKRRPIYLITPGNHNDQCFGADYPGDPIFFEYDGKDYHGLEPSFGQKPQEIAKAIKCRRR